MNVFLRLTLLPVLFLMGCATTSESSVRAAGTDSSSAQLMQHLTSGLVGCPLMR